MGIGGSLSESWRDRSWASGGIPVMVSSLDFNAGKKGTVSCCAGITGLCPGTGERGEGGTGDCPVGTYSSLGGRLVRFDPDRNVGHGRCELSVKLGRKLTDDFDCDGDLSSRVQISATEGRRKVVGRTGGVHVEHLVISLKSMTF